MARDVIKRHQYADYLNTGTTESPTWVFMGVGFTQINEEPGAQSESVKYVCDKAASSEVVSYETKFPFEAEQIMSEAAIDDIYKIARNHGVGSEAVREYCRVELWNQVQNNGTPVANTFTARKFTVSVEVSSFSGDNKQTISGSLNAIGDPIDGTFNTASTPTFTATPATT